MTVNNDIDDDSATKHGDSHSERAMPVDSAHPQGHLDASSSMVFFGHSISWSCLGRGQCTGTDPCNLVFDLVLRGSRLWPDTACQRLSKQQQQQQQL